MPHSENRHGTVQRDILRILEILVAVEEYREEVHGVCVGQDISAGAGSSTGEEAGEGVQEDISLEKSAREWKSSKPQK